MFFLQIDLVDALPGSLQFLTSVLTALIPSSVLLLNHNNKDTVVVVVSALRRVVPAALHACDRMSAQLGKSGTSASRYVL